MGGSKSGSVWLATLVASAPAWTSATAAEPPPSSWLSRASHEEVAAALPKLGGWSAMFRGAMRCAVEDSGELSKCRVILETPVGMGIGSGLLSLAPKYRRKPPGEKGAREVIVAEGWAPFDTPGDWSRRPTPNDLAHGVPHRSLQKGDQRVRHHPVHSDGSGCADRLPVGRGIAGRDGLRLSRYRAHATVHHEAADLEGAADAVDRQHSNQVQTLWPFVG